MNQNNKSDKLGTKPIFQLLVQMSIPAIIGMSIQALYNVIDSIYIGRLSTQALSALSLTFPMQMILIAISAGTGAGTSSLISRLLGKSKYHEANNAAEHVVLISIIYGIIVGIIGFFFADNLMQIFTDSPVLIDLGRRYIRIIMIGSTAMFIPMIFNNILRGEGNTFVPMLTMLIGAIINIILDPLLIFGIGFFPRLGVEGAAYATVFARLISGIFISIVLFSDKNQIKLKMKEFTLNFKIIKDIYKVGFPAMLMQLLASIMLGGMNTIVGSYDVTAIAVTGIYFRLSSFVFLPIIGLSQGLMPIVGYNYGHNKPKRMKKTIYLGTIIAFIFTLCGFALFQFLPEQLIRLFNSNEELLAIGIPALKRISIAYIVMGLNIIGSTIFQSIGKGFPSLFISLFRQLFLLLPIMYILGKLFGLKATWYAIPISEVLAFVVLALWLVSTLKKAMIEMKKKNLTQKQ